ncbi:MAG: hypothetical protein ACM3OB_08860 [Acidobacteriota bacterium]
MPFCSEHVSWLYRLESNYSWQSSLPIAEDVAFQDKNGKVRLILEQGGRITVTRGYAWNGCSPKFCFFDLILGTPDGVVDPRTGHAKTWCASLVHDALYQFVPDGLPLRRAQCDRCFLELLRLDGFRLRGIYWAAVRIFGGLVRRGIRRARQTRGTKLVLESAA